MMRMGGMLRVREDDVWGGEWRVVRWSVFAVCLVQSESEKRRKGWVVEHSIA